MYINEHTSIAYLIKQEPKALEAIISLAPGFSKLRNPIIRKLMAGRTSIAMAADIGGCNVEAFYNKLSPLGFKPQNMNEQTAKPVPKAETEAPEFPSSKIVEMDVRPLLQQGTDPLAAIMKQLSALKPDEALSIINTFIPTPLIHVLDRKGYTHHINKINDEHYVTTFYPGKIKNEKPEKAMALDPAVFMNKLAEYKTRYKELDVRHLEMPLPMTSILESLFHLPKDHVLYVHHKKFPVFLLPELEERGYQMVYVEHQEGVDLLIYRK
jgi:uncharacterized protein (DUF2249 family)